MLARRVVNKALKISRDLLAGLHALTKVESPRRPLRARVVTIVRVRDADAFAERGHFLGGKPDIPYHLATCVLEFDDEV